MFSNQLFAPRKASSSAPSTSQLIKDRSFNFGRNSSSATTSHSTCLVPAQRTWLLFAFPVVASPVDISLTSRECAGRLVLELQKKFDRLLRCILFQLASHCGSQVFGKPVAEFRTRSASLQGCLERFNYFWCVAFQTVVFFRGFRRGARHIPA